MRFKTTWHLMHLILTILTGLIWLPIWILCALSNNAHNKKLAFEKQFKN